MPSDKGKPSKLLIVVGVVIFLIIANIIVLFVLVDRYRQSVDARREYAALQGAGRQDVTDFTAAGTDAVTDGYRQINSDYVGWLNLPGTAVDYPIVQTVDNEKYLNMTFTGASNRYGAIFADYRCDISDLRHFIIYGHNTSNGEMFGGLRLFLDESYLSDHPTVTLTLDERELTYNIFSARQTDIYDPAYQLDFSEQGAYGQFLADCGAPSDAAHVLTLSTCVSTGDDRQRVIIQAWR
jgi:sortase B